MPTTSRSEAGFTVLEALIATAIVTLVGFVGLAACKAVAHAMSVSTADMRGAAAFDAQAAAFRNDATSAFAVYVPDVDVNGRPNAGQEVDFFAKAGDGRPLRWAYLFDAASSTLRRWDLDSGGVRGVRDITTGFVDGSATYPALGGVTRFVAALIPVDRLGDAATNTAYSGVGGMFARAPRARTIHFHDPVLGPTGAIGGNGVVSITFAGATAARVVHLAGGAMPSGFTVTGLPTWHAIVYRVDQSHRFLLGLAGKSHVFINARVDVTYDNWAHRSAWCDFNLLGDPDGLDPHDPHADYTPNEPIESAESIFAACRARHPLPPDRDAPPNPPDADAVHPPLPGQTAPPCWTQPGPTGRCWPADAPVDWVPPSPFPVEPPPDAWCLGHAASPACRPPHAGPSNRAG